MAENKNNLGELKVKDIMIPNVLTARPDWSLDQLAEFLVENYISGAPVASEQGELLGVVSLTDIVRHGSMHANDIQSFGAHDYYLRSSESPYVQEEIASLRIATEMVFTVRDIMTPMIFDVAEDTTLREAADAMIRGHIHRILVTRDQKVRGIVTALDMLKVIRDQ
jgi:CBS domain-containing protein